MTNQEKSNYLTKHFKHELELLLTAGATLNYFKMYDYGMLTAIPRDSFTVHFRSLLSFFINKKDNNDIAITSFGPTGAYNTSEKAWLGKVNESIFHLSPSRHDPKNLPNGDVNQKIDDFKNEIMRLCQEFINDPATEPYHDDMKFAVQEAKKLAAEHMKRLEGGNMVS